MYELELHPHSGADAFVDAEIEAHRGDEDVHATRSTARGLRWSFHPAAGGARRDGLLMCGALGSHEPYGGGTTH